MRNVRLTADLFPEIFQVGAVCVVLFLAGMLWARPVNLMNSDLGRHLQNGNVILEHWQVPEVNLYSYTYPDYPVVNHHWGTGVVFQTLQRMGGISFVIAFMFVVEIFLLALAILAAWRKNGFGPALVAAALALPLVTSRTEIRPEIFSAFFVVLWVGILFLSTNDRWRNALYTLPVLMLFWVNLHVYFFLGIAITFCFFLDELLAAKQKKGSLFVLRALGQSLVLQLFATLMNPESVRGALVPFTLFGNFGYMLAENQSVSFLVARNLFPIFWPFLLFSLALAIAWSIALWNWKKTDTRFPLASLLLTVAFFGMGFFAIRNLSLLGLVSIFVFAQLLATVPQPAMPAMHRTLVGIITALCVFLAQYFVSPLYWINVTATRHLAVEQGNAGVIRFWKEQQLKGPIFNNYDSGGGLIYGLYPQEKVFVDNRPEAYPEAFFNEVYIPMQEDPEVWKREEEKWKFNAVIFYRNDLTPWGQAFLIRLIDDPEWAPVYVDADTILFLKRNEKNKTVIKDHELPRKMFGVSRA